MGPAVDAQVKRTTPHAGGERNSQQQVDDEQWLNVALEPMMGTARWMLRRALRSAPANSLWLLRCASRIHRRFTYLSTLKPIARLAGRKSADDQRQVEDYEIVTPRIEYDLMQDQFRIGRGEDGMHCHDCTLHPDKARRGQQWQKDEQRGLRAPHRCIVAQAEPQSEATVYPPRREQRMLQALRAACDQRYHEPFIVRLEAIKRSGEPGSHRMADKQ